MRYVDDTFVIQQEGHKQTFMEHINKVDLAIKFTVKSNQENGAISFIDTLVKLDAGNTLSITVHRKPTDTDQYLQRDSHHNLAAKDSVIRTLTHRARTVCNKPELLNNEIQHLRGAIAKYKYPKWALDKIERKFINRSQDVSNVGSTQGDPSEEDSHNPCGNSRGKDSTKDKYNMRHIVIPYKQQLGESTKIHVEVCHPDSLQRQ